MVAVPESFAKLCEECVLLDYDNSGEREDFVARLKAYLQCLNSSVVSEFSSLQDLLGILVSGFDCDSLFEAMNKVQATVPEEHLKVSPANVQGIRMPAADRLQQDKDLMQAFVAEANEHLDQIELQMLIWERNPDSKDTINDLFRPFHTIKGIASFLDLLDIRDLSHALEDLLSLVRNGSLYFQPDLLELLYQGTDYLKQLVGLVNALLNQHEYPLPRISIPEFVEKVRSRCGQNLNLERKRTALVEASVARTLEVETEANQTAEASVQLPKVQTQSSLKVDTSKLDALLDLVGELVISNNILQGSMETLGISDKRVVAELSQLRRVVNALQYNSLSLRMVPLAATFQKMFRIVRDVSQKLGKKIDLIVEGEGTEVDRNIVDDLYEPLVHMIRNACDHGLESPEERQRAGKPDTGTLRLQAGHRDGAIVITISDNGRGISPEKVRQTAIKNGLISEGAVLSHNELCRLILAPGFSTASQVTDLSGRGVGMDIVMQSIGRLRGTLDVDSVEGSSTSFTLRFPLTLAILEGMIVQVGRERFIIPTLNIRESLRPIRDNCVTVMGRGEMIKVRDQLIPLLRLHQVFATHSEIHNPWEGIIVVVESDGRPYAILIDQLLGKQEIVIKTLGQKFQGLRAVAGGAILGDGRVGLILDVGQLFQMVLR